VRLGVLQEFLAECPEDRRANRCRFRPRIVGVNLAQPQRPAVFLFYVLCRVPVLCFGGLPDSEAFHRSVRLFDGPSEVVPVDFAAFVEHFSASLPLGFGLRFILVALRPSA
jgi:hypothetical protein